MIVNDNLYPINVRDVGNLREVLMRDFYNVDGMQILKRCIVADINPISVDIVPHTYSFNVKIKKSSMKRIPGFTHTTDFYCMVMSHIFHRFIWDNYSAIIKSLRSVYDDDAQSVLNYLLNGKPELLSNLAQVTILNDSVIIIKL